MNTPQGNSESISKENSMKASTWLLDFKHDEYSQTGEDGIVEKILEVLPHNDRWCVEFGAWDGIHLTNTRHLILSKDFSAVLIEANKKKFQDLQRNYDAQKSRVIPLNCFVGYGDDDNLDVILRETPIPQDFDFLSIDIDGNDYHVWKKVEYYRPKIVVIEFNPTIPMEVKFVQQASPVINQGSSLLSLVELGKEKGYELVCVLTFNAFFVRKEDFHLFQIESNAPQDLRTDLSAVTYFFTGFDGRVFLQGACKLPWHGIELNDSDVQQLPRFIRKYPGEYTYFQKIVFSLFMLIKKPAHFKIIVRKRLDRLTKRFSAKKIRKDL